MRVLLVDGDADNRNVLALLLNLTGHETRLAADGCEALLQAADFRPDVTFLDIRLPRMNGYDVARQLRCNATSPRIISLSGVRVDPMRALAAGIDGQLLKPARVADILRIMQAAA